MAKRKKVPLVYFIRSGKFVKIGTTTDMSKRIKQLQTGSPEQLKLLGIIPGDRVIERQIHIKLKKYHYRAEWFLAEPEVIEMLDACKKSNILDQAISPLGRCCKCQKFLTKRAKLKTCKKCRGRKRKR